MTVAHEPASPDKPSGLVAVPARTPSEHLRLLLRLSETLAVATTVEQVATTVTDVAREYLGAMFGGVAVIDGTSGWMHFLTLDRLPESLQRSRRTFELSSPRPAARVARERRALFMESLSAAVQLLDADSAGAARESGGHAFAYLPMLLGGTAVGTIALVWADETAFTHEDQKLLWALARYSAQALDRARLLAAHREVAHTLQAALLPTLPQISWLEMFADYRPANLAVTVGGDWYDAFISEPGDHSNEQTLTVVVGDVAGHDTHAAAEMARLQAKLRALAIDHPDDPHLLLHRLDHVMTANVHNRLATAVVANLTPRTDGVIGIAWSNAGHLPPLVLEPGMEPFYLERTPDALLGLDETLPRHTHWTSAAPGTTILMFTDGLIERRGHDIDESLATFVSKANEHRNLDLPDLIDALMAEATISTHDDDTVLLGLRIPMPPAKPTPLNAG